MLSADVCDKQRPKKKSSLSGANYSAFGKKQQKHGHKAQWDTLLALISTAKPRKPGHLMPDGRGQRMRKRAEVPAKKAQIWHSPSLLIVSVVWQSSAAQFGKTILFCKNRGRIEKRKSGYCCCSYSYSSNYGNDCLDWAKDSIVYIKKKKKKKSLKAPESWSWTHIKKKKAYVWQSDGTSKQNRKEQAAKSHLFYSHSRLHTLLIAHNGMEW